MRNLQPKPLFDEGLLLQFLSSRSIPLIHAQTLWKHFLKNPFSSFAECAGLPKSLYPMLENEFSPLTSKIEKRDDSLDGSTTKLLIQLQDGSRIETVIMRYDKKEKESKSYLKYTPQNNNHTNGVGRATVCISSQVGCKMACTFCATGTMGFMSQLTSGEIIEQLVYAKQIEPIRNVVFMGMGEPLDNYEALLMSIKAMLDVRRFGLSASHICVSTVGIIPRMKQLINDFPEVHLALSLHAPTQELRTQIVPTAKAYPLDKLISTLDLYFERGHKIMIEYIVIGNVNDDEQTAHNLGKLLQGKNVVVNLIPYNPTLVKASFVPPTNDALQKFEKIVIEYGLLTTVRRTMGQDIAGACGQLVVQEGGCSSSSKKNTERSGTDLVDIEDVILQKEHKDPPLIKRKNKQTKKEVETPLNGDTIAPTILESDRKSTTSIVKTVVLVSLVLFLFLRFIYKYFK